MSILTLNRKARFLSMFMLRLRGVASCLATGASPCHGYGPGLWRAGVSGQCQCQQSCCRLKAKPYRSGTGHLRTDTVTAWDVGNGRGVPPGWGAGKGMGWLSGQDGQDGQERPIGVTAMQKRWK